MAVVNQQPVLYYQTDPRWKNISYAVLGESTTIGASGCGPTSMAMVLATWADASVTPKTECAWALKNGYKCLNSGTYYSYFVPAARRYGLSCTQLNGASIYNNANSSYHAMAKQAVDNGDFVIACMGKGLWTRSGHYVLLWGIEGNMVYINDPASSKVARTRGNYLVFKQQVKYYWVIKRPANRPLVTPETYADVNYAVKVTDREGLNCRKGPGLSYEVMKVYPYETEIRISQVSGTGWGKTDKGWVNLTNTERVNEMAMTKREFIESLTGEEAYELVSKALSYMGDREEPGWSKSEGAWEKAVQNGVVNGGAPERPVKRDELVAILSRLGLI